jgi:hypothetical protein
MVFRSHPIGACCMRSGRLQGFIPQKLAHFDEHILTLHTGRPSIPCLVVWCLGFTNPYGFNTAMIGVCILAAVAMERMGCKLKFKHYLERIMSLNNRFKLSLIRKWRLNHLRFKLKYRESLRPDT